MELFYAPGSSSSLPRIVLHETELPFEAIKIDEQGRRACAMARHSKPLTL
jgi:glutathione S-transferase